MSKRLLLEELSMPPNAIPFCRIPLCSDLLGKHPIPDLGVEEGALRAGLLCEPVDARLDISRKHLKEPRLSRAHAPGDAASRIPLPYPSEYLQITATLGNFRR